MSEVVVRLTLAEARALQACAGEGFEGLATDDAAAKAYLGGKRGVDAGERAIGKLDAAICAALKTPNLNDLEEKL